ncbi:MAG: hypothetical protein US89_C0005G0109 [Candidatus Peregrinibacteria bacterium GW2011_GWF2_38_29]|nr:MAG: hypothetical protein US89_C0005G0109 [Candidatus Peregrinibacteria bacterium GW2011_GWF2_38_29]HBB02696.1 hypothetical protein [Candidatus Peregrinibacteria bacterium]
MQSNYSQNDDYEVPFSVKLRLFFSAKTIALILITASIGFGIYYWQNQGGELKGSATSGKPFCTSGLFKVQTDQLLDGSATSQTVEDYEDLIVGSEAARDANTKMTNTVSCYSYKAEMTCDADELILLLYIKADRSLSEIVKKRTQITADKCSSTIPRRAIIDLFNAKIKECADIAVSINKEITASFVRGEKALQDNADKITKCNLDKASLEKKLACKKYTEDIGKKITAKDKVGAKALYDANLAGAKCVMDATLKKQYDDLVAVTQATSTTAVTEAAAESNSCTAASASAKKTLEDAVKATKTKSQWEAYINTMSTSKGSISASCTNKAQIACYYDQVILFGLIKSEANFKTVTAKSAEMKQSKPSCSPLTNPVVSAAFMAEFKECAELSGAVIKEIDKGSVEGEKALKDNDTAISKCNADKSMLEGRLACVKYREDMGAKITANDKNGAEGLYEANSTGRKCILTEDAETKYQELISAVEEVAVEEPVVEEPVVVEESVVEEPVIETPAVEEPVVETPAVETPVVETPVVETPVVAVETPTPSELCEAKKTEFDTMLARDESINLLDGKLGEIEGMQYCNITAASRERYDALKNRINAAVNPGGSDYDYQPQATPIIEISPCVAKLSDFEAMMAANENMATVNAKYENLRVSNCSLPIGLKIKYDQFTSMAASMDESYSMDFSAGASADVNAGATDSATVSGDQASTGANVNANAAAAQLNDAIMANVLNANLITPKFKPSAAKRVKKTAETGPEVMLYPIFMIASVGAVSLIRRRKNRK